MNILVSGGAGFIGNQLCEQLLQEDHTVYCIDDLSLGQQTNIQRLEQHPNFHFFAENLLNKPFLTTFFNTHPITTIFHLAANSDIQEGSKYMEIDLNKTLLTTCSLLDHVKKHQIKEFIFASSSAIYGPQDTTLDEAFGQHHPISYYGAAKLASEAFINACHEQTSFKSWTFRFPNVVGPYMTHGVLHDFINKLQKDPSTLEILGDGNQKKPYTHVNDLVNGILHGWKHSQNDSNIFNLGVTDQTTVTEIASLTVKAMTLSNVTFTYTGGQKGWKGDVPTFQYNLKKIHALGWTPKYNSTEAITVALTEELNRLKNQHK